EQQRATSVAVADAGEPANLCTESFRRWERLFARRDWNAMGAAVTDDYEYQDHRPVVGVHEIGRDAHIRTMRILAEQGGEHIGMTFHALRGERLALATIGAESTSAEPEH